MNLEKYLKVRNVFLKERFDIKVCMSGYKGLTEKV